MAVATMMDAVTMMDASALGRISRNRMRSYGVVEAYNKPICKAPTPARDSVDSSSRPRYFRRTGR
jgi:hypothetical protein